MCLGEVPRDKCFYNRNPVYLGIARIQFFSACTVIPGIIVPGPKTPRIWKKNGKFTPRQATKAKPP